MKTPRQERLESQLHAMQEARKVAINFIQRSGEAIESISNDIAAEYPPSSNRALASAKRASMDLSCALIEVRK